MDARHCDDPGHAAAGDLPRQQRAPARHMYMWTAARCRSCEGDHPSRMNPIRVHTPCGISREWTHFTGSFGGPNRRELSSPAMDARHCDDPGHAAAGDLSCEGDHPSRMNPIRVHTPCGISREWTLSPLKVAAILQAASEVQTGGNSLRLQWMPGTVTTPVTLQRVLTAGSADLLSHRIVADILSRVGIP
jgi:hypothetical protein